MISFAVSILVVSSSLFIGFFNPTVILLSLAVATVAAGAGRLGYLALRSRRSEAIAT
jgi:hypothetical protein